MRLLPADTAERFLLFGTFFGLGFVGFGPTGFEVLGSRPRLQYLTVGKGDLLDAPAGFAVPEWPETDGNFIPRFERVPPPAVSDHVDGSLGLPNPMRHFAVIARYVEPQEAMRIGPQPVHDCPLHGNGLRGIKHRIGMVGE